MAHPATITKDARLKRAIEVLRMLLLTVGLLVRHVQAGAFHRGAAARSPAPGTHANSRNPAHRGNNPEDCRNSTNTEFRGARLERSLAWARCTPRVAPRHKSDRDKRGAGRDTKYRRRSTTSRNGDRAN